MVDGFLSGNASRWLWVPAFAGTTDDGLAKIFPPSSWTSERDPGSTRRGGCCLIAMVDGSLSDNASRWLWVPAFAGTTTSAIAHDGEAHNIVLLVPLVVTKLDVNY
jgi:hypothetical protein